MRISITEEASSLEEYDYATFPREFVSYRWLKPLLVAALGVAFYFVFALALMLFVTVWTGGTGFIESLSGTYDDMDAYTGPGALVELGSIAAIIPALALAALIVRDRPFSSYSSSRGGWKWSAFFKCLLVAIAVMAVDFAVESLFFPGEPGSGVSKFTPVGLVLCVVLVPLQCVAEEYLFRGFLLQAFASWTKLPAVGIAVAAALFAAGHPYNEIGVIAIFCNGVIWGYVAWRTRGLEATSALHIVNNMLAFLADGFGFQTSSSTVPVEGLVAAVAVDIIFAAAVLVGGQKFGWFAPKGDGAAVFNEKKRAKLERKRQRREARRPESPQDGGEPATRGN